MARKQGTMELYVEKRTWSAGKRKTTSKRQAQAQPETQRELLSLGHPCPTAVPGMCGPQKSLKSSQLKLPKFVSQDNFTKNENL